MCSRMKSKPVALLVVFAFLVFLSPNLLNSQTRDTGSITGVIFAKDGTTPYPNAVITVKNVGTGREYKSQPTDNRGQFRVDGMPKGVYVFGVSTPQGDFNSEDLIGIEPGKTAKISIALSAFDERTAAAAQEVYTDQSRNKSGEALVGKVIAFDRTTKMATVFMLRGFVKLTDKLHIMGPDTDFYNDLKVLSFEGVKVTEAFAGQTVNMEFEYDAFPNDLVYVVCKKGGFPLFLIPIGVAAIVAGSGSIIVTGELTKETEVSTFRKK